MKGFCKVLITLSKYKGFTCNTVNDAEYVFEIEWPPQTDPYNNGSFCQTTYQNGEQKDLVFNGWSFSGINKGRYHLAGSSKYVNIQFECYDPNHSRIVVENGTNETDDFITEGPVLYMNKIMIICLFKDKKEWCNVKDIIYNNYPALSDKDKLKETLNKLKVFKEVIKRNEGNVNIPSHFISHAQNEYKRIVNIIQEKVEIDKILDAIFD